MSMKNFNDTNGNRSRDLPVCSAVPLAKKEIIVIIIIIIPVIIGATGTISKSFRKYVSDIPGNHDVRELQKKPYWALHTYCGKC
jgi:hypothetical protein